MSKGMKDREGSLAPAEIEEQARNGKGRGPGGVGMRCPWDLVGQGGLAPLTLLASVLVLISSHLCFFSLSC